MGAIACALLHRERTGQGQYIDVSLLDTYFHCQTIGVQLCSAIQGAREIKPRTSSLPRLPGRRLQGQKRWFIILRNDRQTMGQFVAKLSAGRTFAPILATISVR
jgi:crotonobetainyl-CoA:carnitine CoA-transferase CaiB-like acyl-CoA transferase